MSAAESVKEEEREGGMTDAVGFFGELLSLAEPDREGDLELLILPDTQEEGLGGAGLWEPPPVLGEPLTDPLGEEVGGTAEGELPEEREGRPLGLLRKDRVTEGEGEEEGGVLEGEKIVDADTDSVPPAAGEIVPPP